MKQLKLSDRLSTATHYVRDGAIVADIGTDHAYIPIFLTLEGRVKHAIASDINEGPILRARENILEYGLEGKITTRISNGLNGIEQYEPTDILICGMGGELIADIIDACEYVKKSNIRLILQPMTSIYELRSYLKNGFLTIDENIVYEDGKFYQIICVEYDGITRSYSDAELELGSMNIKKREPVFLENLKFLIEKKRKIMQGIKKGGGNTEKIEKNIKELEMLL